MIGNELNGTENGRVEHAAWLAEPERGSRPVMRFITWLALRWGRRATRWLTYPLALYFLAFAPRARRASRAFLTRALAREAGASDVLRNFHAFAGTLHDRMYLLSGRFEDLAIEIEGAQELEAMLDAGRGCILLGSHLGSFEALRALGRHHKRYPINIVMYAGTTQKSSEVLNELAPELNARVIAPGRPESMLRIKECLERGEIVGILGDRPSAATRRRCARFSASPRVFPRGRTAWPWRSKRPSCCSSGSTRAGTATASSSRCWPIIRPESLAERIGAMGRTLRGAARALRPRLALQLVQFL